MPTYYALLLTAVLMIALELFTSLRNQKTFFDGAGGAAWSRVYRWRWLAGVPFAVLSAFLHYTASGGEGVFEVRGFPLVVAMVDEQGLSYAGPMSVPFLVANAAIWFFVPHILLHLWTLLARLSRQN